MDFYIGLNRRNERGCSSPLKRKSVALPAFVMLLTCFATVYCLTHNEFSFLAAILYILIMNVIFFSSLDFGWTLGIVFVFGSIIALCIIPFYSEWHVVRQQTTFISSESDNTIVVKKDHLVNLPEHFVIKN